MVQISAGNMRGAQQLPRAWGLSLLRVTTSGAACSHTFVIGACISVSASISLHQFTFYPNYLPGINILLFNFILRGHQPPPRGHQSLATYYFFRKIVSGGECPEKVRHFHQTTSVLRRGWGGDKETPTGSRLNLTVLKNELFSHHQKSYFLKQYLKR